MFDAHRMDWFSIGLDDPATFNQVLANSELHLEATRHPDRLPQETSTSIRYHQLALTAVRERLVKGEVSFKLLGTVTGLLAYAVSHLIASCCSDLVSL